MFPFQASRGSHPLANNTARRNAPNVSPQRRPRTYPEASPYTLPHTVLGTAVISTEELANNEDFFILVPRTITPTTATIVSPSVLSDADSELAFQSVGSGSVTPRLRSGGPSPCNYNNISPPPPQQRQGQSDPTRTPTSGNIIFTDEFLQQHPTSYIATISREYGVNSSSSATNAKGILTYIGEAQLEQRPMFRLKSSDDIYGSAKYLPHTSE